MHCTYDPATRGGNAPDGRKVKATIHWVSAAHAVDAEVRLYDNLFTKENPGDVPEGAGLHRQSQPELAGGPDRRQARAVAGRGQAGRLATSSSGWATSASIPIRQPGALVFNRTVTLRDTWAKIEKREKKI